MASEVPQAGEEVKPDLWRHKRTGGIYARIAVPMKILGDDGSWYPAVLYRAPDGTHYARTVKGFQNAFEQHPRPEECHGQ